MFERNTKYFLLVFFFKPLFIIFQIIPLPRPSKFSPTAFCNDNQNSSKKTSLNEVIMLQDSEDTMWDTVYDSLRGRR